MASDLSLCPAFFIFIVFILSFFCKNVSRHLAFYLLVVTGGVCVCVYMYMYINKKDKNCY